MEMLSTQIDAQDTTFIEIWKSFWKNLKTWLTMADFQRIQEKWLIQEIGEGIE